jgi:exosortase family protein XrtF
MNSFSIREFKPTILFLTKFLGIYLVMNLLYGLYVTNYRPRPDPVTRWVSEQTGWVITACGWPTVVRDHRQKPTTELIFENRPVLAVYEGCNGINTFIVFVAFVIAFGPAEKKMLWFIPLGIVIIHLANLARITLLFFVAEYRPNVMYFVHKYLFTASLYVVIFLLWIWWVKSFASKKSG